MYFINTLVFLVCILTGAAENFSVANDKNRIPTTMSKMIGFICSLTGKFKNETGLR